MKNSLLINSSLLNNFWIEVMKTANYLWNHLFLKAEIYGEPILEEK